MDLKLNLLRMPRGFSPEFMKMLAEAAELHEKKRGVFEEWPELPHESWRWSLSPPARELETELVRTIKRYLNLRK